MPARTLSDLTINEIDIGNRRLPDGSDLETAIVDGGRQRYAALAVLAWLHERRTNPDSDLGSWRDKTPDQLMEYLGEPDAPPPPDAASDPTAPPR